MATAGRVFLSSRLWPWLAFAAALLLAPRVFPSGLGLSVLSQIGIAMIACLSYNLLFGQGGMLSFGHAVYSGMGAYMAIHALNLVGQGVWSWPVSLLPLVGGAAGMAVAAVFGWFSTRRGGMPFAMISLGLAELVFAAVLMFPGVFGGEAGIAGNRVVGAARAGVTFAPAIEVYHLIAAYTGLCAAAMFAFTRTPLGRLLNAVRDNPERVAYIGYSAHRIRYAAFVIAGFFAGVAGGLGALHFEIVTAEVVGTARSGAYLLFTVVGGSGHFAGPLLGAVLMVLSSVLFSEWTRAWLLYLGLAFLFIVMVAPGGVAGGVAALWQGLNSGRWRHAGPADRMAAAAAALGGLAMAAGLAALLEMLYHLQLRQALGDSLPFMGLVLQVSGRASWLGAAALAACGGALGWWARRRRLALRGQPGAGA
jgi:branched-chain amino acid transport system permease protein